MRGVVKAVSYAALVQVVELPHLMDRSDQSSARSSVLHRIGRIGDSSVETSRKIGDCVPEHDIGVRWFDVEAGPVDAGTQLVHHPHQIVGPGVRLQEPGTFGDPGEPAEKRWMTEWVSDREELAALHLLRRRSDRLRGDTSDHVVDGRGPLLGDNFSGDDSQKRAEDEADTAGIRPLSGRHHPKAHTRERPEDDTSGLSADQ